MSEPVQRAEREAMQWLLRLQADPAQAASIAFAHWHDAAPEHQRAWRALQDGLGAALQGLRATPQAASDGGELRRLLVRGPSRRRFIGRALAWTGVGWLGLHHWQTRADWTSAVAQRRSVNLADGTELLLDADSRVRFAPARRALTLLQGAVIAQVPEQGAPAFSACCEAGVVQAPQGVATRFMLRRHADSGTVAALQGGVAVAAANGARAWLPEGAAARYGAFGIERLDSAQAQAAPLWREGRLQVLDAPLADVAEALAPYMPGILRVSAEAGALRVQGVFALDRPQEAWTLLATILPVRVTRYGGWLTLVEHA